MKKYQLIRKKDKIRFLIFSCCNNYFYIRKKEKGFANKKRKENI